MVGLLEDWLDAPAETTGTSNIAATAARMPVNKDRVNRMRPPLLDCGEDAKFVGHHRSRTATELSNDRKS
jgi:hypothetical protein